MESVPGAVATGSEREDKLETRNPKLETDLMVAETKTEWTIASSSIARTWLNRLAPFLGLVLVIVIFAVLLGAPERYLSLRNLRTVLAQTVIVAIGAIGMTIIIISGGIDLSVGSAIALTGVITALGINAGWPTTMAVAAGIFVGGVVGIVNGLAITRLRVVPFIATLGMLGVARGVAKGLAGSQTVNVPDTWANDLLLTIPKHAWLLMAPGVWIAIILAVAAAVGLRRTVLAGASSLWDRTKRRRVRAGSRPTA